MKTLLGKHLFFLVILLIVGMPLLQMKYHLIDEKSLKGVEESEVFPDFNMKDVFAGRYQQQLEQWFAKNFGFRKLLVRINNQLYYSIFNQTPPNSTVEVCKQKQLMEKGYIKHYLTMSEVLSVEEISNRVGKLEEIDRLLKNNGKKLVLLITPSKASFYSETIPDYYHPDKRVKNKNYNQLVEKLVETKLAYVDGPQIIREAQKQHPHIPMFPRGGIHWNQLSAYYVVKKLIETINVDENHQTNGLSIKSMEVDNKPVNSDRDLADLINLVKSPVNYKVPHVTFEKNTKDKGKRLNLLIKGGSFNWILTDLLAKADVFNNTDFYYYYSKHYHREYADGYGKGEKIDRQKWPVDIQSIDVIILEINESIIFQLGKEFSDDLIKKLELTEK